MQLTVGAVSAGHAPSEWRAASELADLAEKRVKRCDDDLFADLFFPARGVLLAADETGLTGAWFEGQKYFARTLTGERIERETSVLAEAKRWLDRYFSGEAPDRLPPLHPQGSDFQKAVWELLVRIPYGRTMTYGELAAALAVQQGRDRMSAQAVGGAVGHNPISVIVPCHRVVGASGSLTGYAGGVGRKMELLALEGADMSHLFVPKKGTAL